MSLTFSQLHPDNIVLQQQIAEWYEDEWGLPQEQSLANLGQKENDTVLFQLVVEENEQVIGTGGLYRRVGIQNHLPKYLNQSPWIGLMYTLPSVRGRSIGAQLLAQIEQGALALGYEKIFLFTYSAAPLYARQAWVELEAVHIRGKDVVVMEKLLG